MARGSMPARDRVTGLAGAERAGSAGACVRELAVVANVPGAAGRDRIRARPRDGAYRAAAHPQSWAVPSPGRTNWRRMCSPWLWSETLAGTHRQGSGCWGNSLKGPAGRKSAWREITWPPTRRSWSESPICVPGGGVEQSPPDRARPTQAISRCRGPGPGQCRRSPNSFQ